MSEFKEAFAGINAIDWSDVPKDSLSAFLEETYLHAELLANSVPLPSSSNGSKAPAFPTKNVTSAAETLVTPHPTKLDEKYTDLQKPWGKPIKLNAKDNPLSVSVYKTAGHDRKGAWFARRSLHGGLSFEKWKNGMKREFITSLKVKKGPGSGAVRGIAGDKRLEKERVEGVGNAEVWLLSSSFPGPVAPRDFCGLILTSDNALSEASATDGKQPRHFMVISRPTTHPGAAPRDGLVRGQYESIELMREIPGTGEDADSNLIEWIMVTRSDPGGGIPRFMVERGTPGSIVADVPKFIEWAIHRNDEEGDADEADEDREVAEANGDIIDPAAALASEPNLPLKDGNSPEQTGAFSKSTTDVRPPPAGRQPFGVQQNTEGNSSLLGSLTSAIGSTVGGYLPYFGGNELEHHNPGSGQDDSYDSDSSSSSNDTDGTFASAPDGDHDQQHKSNFAADGTSIRSTDSDIDLTKRPLNSAEKELQKLKKQRIELDQKMQRSREAEDKKSKEAESKEESEMRKAQEKVEKDRKKQEEKYQKDVRHLEDKRRKQERKADEQRQKDERRAEERKKKALEKDALVKSTRERDEARAALKIAEGERDAMVKQIEDLQKENTLLIQKMGASESGMSVVQQVKSEALNRSRASSSSSGKNKGITGHTPTASTEKLPVDVNGK